METFLWTLYLAVMIWLTYSLIIEDIKLIALKKNTVEILHITIVSIMWAVWYMYFLH